MIRRNETRGFSLIETMLVVVLGGMVLYLLHMLYVDVRDFSQKWRTLDGFVIINKAFDTAQKRGWRDRTNTTGVELFTSVAIHSATSLHVNGYGWDYQLSTRAGQPSVSTTVPTESQARWIVHRMAGKGAYEPTAAGNFLIHMPIRERRDLHTIIQRLSLKQSGTYADNRMRAPLMFSASASVVLDSICIPPFPGDHVGGLAFLADGRLVSCKLVNPNAPRRWRLAKTAAGGGGSVPGQPGPPAPLPVPPPPTQTKMCWDGSEISVDHDCPARTKICWDGSEIPVTRDCPAQTKTCPGGEEIAVDQTCPCERDHRCWNGDMVCDASECPCEPTVDCWDGSSVCPSEECPCEPIKRCPDGGRVCLDEDCDFFECWDGSRVEDEAECPCEPTHRCWDDSEVCEASECPCEPTHRCWDRSEVCDASECPCEPTVLCENENEYVCPEDWTSSRCDVPQHECWDETFVDDPRDCPCEPTHQCWDDSYVCQASECSCEPTHRCWDRSYVCRASECPCEPTQLCEKENTHVCPEDWTSARCEIPQHQCWDGTFVDDPSDCPCEPTHQCWDDSYVCLESECPAEQKQCWDGTWIPVGDTCPCEPDHQCWDDSWVCQASDCPPEQKQCWDGTWIPVTEECPCEPDHRCWNDTYVCNAGECPCEPTVSCWDGSRVCPGVACPIQCPIVYVCPDESWTLTGTTCSRDSGEDDCVENVVGYSCPEGTTGPDSDNECTLEMPATFNPPGGVTISPGDSSYEACEGYEGNPVEWWACRSGGGDEGFYSCPITGPGCSISGFVCTCVFQAEEVVEETCTDIIERTPASETRPPCD